RLERLPFAQLLSGGDGHDRLLPPAPTFGVDDIGVAERDRRAVLVGPQRVVTEHEIGRHHLRDAGDWSRVLVRAGSELRLSYLAGGLAICRRRRAGKGLAASTADVVGRCGRRGRRRQQPVAEGSGDRRDDDEQAGDKEPGNPTGRCSPGTPTGGFAVGHAAIQGSIVLPARMWFSIRRRYAPALASEHASVDRRG